MPYARQGRVYYDYRASVARHSRYMYANSRQILTDCRQNWESDIPGARQAQVTRVCRATFALHVCELKANFGNIYSNICATYADVS